MRDILLSTAIELLDNRIFEIDNPMWKANNYFVELYELKTELLNIGYNLKTIDLGNPITAEKILFLDIPPQNTPHFRFFSECVRMGLQNKMILILHESPAILPLAWNEELHKNFAKILTWNDDLVDNIRYFKLNYAQPFLRTVPQTPFAQRKLCTMIAGNKFFYHPLELYSKRVEAIRAFERLSPYQFDLYGTGWNRPKSQVENALPFLVPHFPSYRGNVREKAEVLSKYKYAICYENMLGVNGFSGYITEKIHHCFMSGCVPIYLGANNIEKYISKELFIDRRQFPNYDSLYGYLLSIDQAKYENMLEKIEQYLKSNSFKTDFSVEACVEKIINSLDIINVKAEGE